MMIKTRKNPLPQVVSRSIFLLLMTLSSSFSAQAQNIADLFEQVNKSVVVIIITERTPGDLEEETEFSLGSGVLISEEGHILTAEHVVGLADEIVVEFPSKETINAKVLKSSVAADLALIQLDEMPKEYTVAKIGNSDAVRVGEQVFIIGAPRELDQSLSVGYISGRKKELTFTNSIVFAEYFQTDASINPGNSGGPMFNMKGEVIGIVSYILSESGGFEGIGFAATSNMAKKLMESNLMWSGMEGHFLDEELCQFFNVPQSGAILVQRLAKNSLLLEAGLKAGYKKISIDDQEFILGGDIILSVADVPFTNRESIIAIRNKITLNTTSIPIKVLRKGKVITINIEL
ncbi:MAG: trypsin-like peptidase domain-containing protein [Bacteroidota bacterium]